MMIESARHTASGEFCVTIDGREMIVPDDMANRERQMLAAWVAEGNTIEPYVPPPQTLKDYERAIQDHIDATAREKGYENGLSCSTYVASTNALWAAEAQAFVAWRDSVWSYAFQELAKVENGEREQPTIEEFIAELPAINWPQT